MQLKWEAIEERESVFYALNSDHQEACEYKYKCHFKTNV